MDRLKNIMFFFKEKPIEITFFLNPSDLILKKIAPIRPAVECIPQWWKDIPSSSFEWETFNSKNTVKSCPGIIQTLKNGFILPMWSDLALKITDFGVESDEIRYGYKYHSADKKTELEDHDQSQSPGFYPDHWHFKIRSPWVIQSTVPLLYLSPFYLYKTPPPFIQPHAIIPGIDNTFATNTFIFFEKNKNLNYMFNFLDPLYQIIPLTDKKYVHKIEVLDWREWANIPAFHTNHFFKRGLKNISHFKK
jgi:hypothetical protein